MRRLLLAVAGSAAAWVLTAAVAHAACSRSLLPDGSSRFVAERGEVRDRLTRLVWRQCSVGLAWQAKDGCTGERTDVTYAEAQAAAKDLGGGWRLPTIGELSSLIDQDCGRPAIDTSVFPDVTASTDEGAEEYWSATPGGLNDMMYFAEFSDGYRDIRSPGFHRHARLVRGPL